MNLNEICIFPILKLIWVDLKIEIAERRNNSSLIPLSGDTSAISSVVQESSSALWLICHVPH